VSADLRSAIVAALERTTITYPAWVKAGRPKASNWALAFSLIDLLEPPRANPVPPPKVGAYLGAYIEGAETYGFYYPKEAPWSNAPDVKPWDRFERNAGKQIAMLMIGQPAFFSKPFDYDGDVAATVARGAIPVLDVDTSQTGTLADIAAGKHDASITAVAKGAATYAKWPFVLRVDCEMNGTWYPYGAEARKSPAVFLEAWRHIHDIFTTAGAANVSWHWCPNVDPENTQTPLEQLYPGDNYVDWIGMTGYNHGGETCSSVFDSTYARLVKLAPSRPIMVGEVGSVDAGFPGQKAAFIEEFFADLAGKYSQVRGFCWFNWRTDEHSPPWDWPIESSAASLAAFKAAVASPAVVGR
jgi:mannan endo-1,4-beta-mannosidase